MVAGGLTMVVAHGFNQWLCRSCRACSSGCGG